MFGPTCVLKREGGTDIEKGKTARTGERGEGERGKTGVTKERGGRGGEGGGLGGRHLIWCHDVPATRMVGRSLI